MYGLRSGVANGDRRTKVGLETGLLSLLPCLLCEPLWTLSVCGPRTTHLRYTLLGDTIPKVYLPSGRLHRTQSVLFFGTVVKVTGFKLFLFYYGTSLQYLSTFYNSLTQSRHLHDTNELLVFER